MGTKTMSEHTSLKDDIDTGKGRVADAVRGHWADTLLPLWFRPYARLSRLERPHWLVAASLALPLVSHFGGGDSPKRRPAKPWRDPLVWCCLLARSGCDARSRMHV